jgi:hypothetical protein
MNLTHFDGIGWLLLLLGPLFILQRSLHREIQGLLLIATRRPSVTIIIFSIIFFPGVLLHEVSHFLMAKLLGVHTGRVSLFPRPMKGGHLRLGFVETAPTDILRDAFIGAAPLLTGVAVVAYIGIIQMDLVLLGNALITSQLNILGQEIKQLPLMPDFWLWFYLVFVISSTMLPSSSDRRAWLPMVGVAVILLLIGIFVGFGPWLVTEIAPAFNQGMRTLSAIFGISIAVHFIILIPTWTMRMILGRITGLSIK